MSAYFVGVMFKPRNDWQQYAMEPTAPANYKDPKKINDYIENARLEQAGDVAVAALLGRLSSVAVLDEDKEVIYQSGAGDQFVGQAFVAWLTNKFPEHFADALRDAEAFPHDVLMGFGLKAALRVAAFETLEHNRSVPQGAKTYVPVRLWYNPIGVYDPEDLLISSREKKQVTWMTIATQLGVTIPQEFGTEARTNAFVCAQLAKAAQLVPAYSGAVVQ